MLIKKHRSWDLKSSGLKASDITPRDLFESRRKFIASTATLGLGAIAGGLPLLGGTSPAHAGTALSAMKNMGHTLEKLGETELTDYAAATQYNNFYEFGTGKSDPVDNARDFKVQPWTVSVEGAVANPGVYGIDDLVPPDKLEERVYRFRCVEAWSMVVPWVGISLGDVIRRLEPTSKARYVAFQTLHDPKQMPGQNSWTIKWPYVEGLRMDEAMNPLSLLCVGMYGETLPNQNGAPIRLVVPWKYGFKSIKSIVRMTFVEDQPPTTWNLISPREYGFYSNVNPDVDHPRWSQSRERRVGDGLFDSKRPTLKFNGYEQDVAELYNGMDLRAYY